MEIKDYIFYRLYVNYTKAKHDGIFASISYFSIIEYCIFIPIIMLINNALDLGKGWDYIPFFMPLAVIFFLNCKRYYKKGRVVEIIRRYRNSKYNTIIKNWMVYSLIFFAIAWGMMGIAIIMESYWYIKGLWS